MFLERLMKGARIAVKQCMNIKSGEKVIIITDKKMPVELSKALAEAVKEVGAKCKIELITSRDIDGIEPSKDIAELMKTPDALFILTSWSISHTAARRNASEAGVRIASMPKVTEFSLTEGGLTADYREVKELTEIMAKKLENAKKIRINSENGTDFTTIVEGREWVKDNGMIHEKGNFCNLPAGEVAVAPVEETSQGTIVIDKMAFYGERIRYTVKNGFAEKIVGSKRLENEVNEVGRLGRNIAEIGIGTNPKARIIGNILEDEKVFGTVHIALGNSLSLHGKVDVPIHLDGIILKPTLEVDGKIIIKDGKWTFLDDSFVKTSKEVNRTVNIEEERKIESKNPTQQNTNSGYQIQSINKKSYEPYIVREPLESHYFDPWIGGWTRLNNRFVINPQLYGYWIKIVEIHEKLHNIYKTGDEGFVERMTQYNFRNGYFNLSGGYSSL
jgi:leucyl aminopeptidase (aminopeptidase T)